MPQERTPYLFELIRGRSACAQACLAEALGLIAKLPSGYQRDLQLLKAPLFRAIDVCAQTLDLLPAALAGVRFLPTNIRIDSGMYAAERASVLAVNEGIPFRDA